MLSFSQNSRGIAMNHEYGNKIKIKKEYPNEDLVDESVWKGTKKCSISHFF